MRRLVVFRVSPDFNHCPDSIVSSPCTFIRSAHPPNWVSCKEKKLNQLFRPRRPPLRLHLSSFSPPFANNYHRLRFPHAASESWAPAYRLQPCRRGIQRLAAVTERRGKIQVTRRLKQYKFVHPDGSAWSGESWCRLRWVPGGGEGSSRCSPLIGLHTRVRSETRSVVQ